MTFRETDIGNRSEMQHVSTSEDTADEEQFYDCLDEPSTPETHDDGESWRDARDAGQPESPIAGATLRLNRENM